MSTRKHDGADCAIVWQLPERCAERGLTARAFGEALKRCQHPRSRAQVYRLFGPIHSVTFKVLDAVCEALECDPGDLLVRVPTMPAHRPPPTFKPPGRGR